MFKVQIALFDNSLFSKVSIRIPDSGIEVDYYLNLNQ